MVKWLRKAVRNLDFFCIPVSLTYKNEPYYTTYVGGCVSIIFGLSLISFVLINLGSIINKESTVSITRKYRNLVEDDSSYLLNHDNFDIAISFLYEEDSDFDAKNYDRYFSLEFDLVRASYSGSSST